MIQQAARHAVADLVNTDLHVKPDMDDQERQTLLAQERINSATAAQRSRSPPKSQCPLSWTRSAMAVQFKTALAPKAFTSSQPERSAYSTPRRMSTVQVFERVKASLLADDETQPAWAD